jgi:hypothetical protein
MIRENPWLTFLVFQAIGIMLGEPKVDMAIMPPAIRAKTRRISHGFNRFVTDKTKKGFIRDDP